LAQRIGIVVGRNIFELEDRSLSLCWMMCDGNGWRLGQNTVLMCVCVAVTGTTVEGLAALFACLARASDAAFSLGCACQEGLRNFTCRFYIPCFFFFFIF